MMAELTYTCQNFSDYHLVVYWSKWSATLVARELSMLGFSPYAQDIFYRARYIEKRNGSGKKKVAGSQEYDPDFRYPIYTYIFQKLGRVRYQNNRHEILH